MTLLAVEQLSKHFDGVHAITELSFEISKGGVHAVIGPNGAGKTTLFNLITGIYRPSGGRVRLCGDDITGLAAHARAARGLSRTFQNLQIFFNMSALENVMMGGHLHADSRLLSAVLRFARLGRKERLAVENAAALMSAAGLSAYIESDSASMPYGALKRLEIARALAAAPKLLLLDEPAAGLNPTEAAEIARFIRQIAEDGVTVLLVEHNMRLVMEISDHVVVLDYGRKLAEGSPREIAANPDVIAAYLGTKAALQRHRRYA